MFGHHIYADQLYSSIPLVNALESRLTCFVGTVDKRRRQLPREVRARSVKLRRGDIKAWRDGNKLCVAWRDKGKPTLMISTGLWCEHSDSSVPPRGPKVKALVVDRYNKFMWGVDVADQFECYCSHFSILGERRRNCIVCNNRTSRHDTKYYCRTCSTHPALHVDICFERYHTPQQYALTKSHCLWKWTLTNIARIVTMN